MVVGHVFIFIIEFTCNQDITVNSNKTENKIKIEPVSVKNNMFIAIPLLHALCPLHVQIHLQNNILHSICKKS